MINKQFNPVPLADGSTMDIWVTYPEENGKYPAILLLQETFGVNAYIRSVAERLCRAGYAVFAPDLFHRIGRLVLLPYAPFNSVLPYAASVTDENLLCDVRVSLQLIQSMPNIESNKIGALGFGMGGRCAFIANCVFPLSAGISYYGYGIEKRARKPVELQSPHLFFWGGQDTCITASQRDLIYDLTTQNGGDLTSVTISYAGHGFHNDELPCYHPLAARQAWMHTLAFFDYLLK
jgi:carboxymethylenebutenolidase